MATATKTICHLGDRRNAKKIVAMPALTPPPRLYSPWQVLIILRLYSFSKKPTVVFTETPFKNPFIPKQYRQIQNIRRFTELICRIIIIQSETYPSIIHLPTGNLLKIFVERATPVNAPNGDSKRERPSVASVKPSRYLIPGIAATHVPNTRLEQANKNPTATTGFNLINDERFLII